MFGWFVGKGEIVSHSNQTKTVEGLQMESGFYYSPNQSKFGIHISLCHTFFFGCVWVHTFEGISNMVPKAISSLSDDVIYIIYIYIHKSY